MNTQPVKRAIKTVLYHLIPKTNGYSDLTVLAGPAKGAKLRLDLRLEGQYWLGNYDSWIFDDIPFATLITPGQVVWDCGAYVGFYSAIFRKLVGSSGEVHTFEAAKPNYDRLRELPAINGWTNVHVHHMAVGPAHSMLEFVENLGGSSGPYGLSKTYEEGARLEISRVACAGVDELVYERGIAAPDFVKFDLESAEEFALHNGERTFREKRPIILLELHGPAAKRAAGEFLERYDYEAVRVGDYHSRRQVLRTSAELDAIEGDWHMTLCTPRQASSS